MQWYTRVVFRWRTTAAVFWLLVNATVVLLLLQFIAACLGLNHVTWLWSTLLSFSFLLVMGAVAVTHAVVSVVPVKVCRNRVSRLLALLQPAHCATVLLYCASGGVATLCLASFIGVGGITLSCSEDKLCLNQELLVLACHGFFSGCQYGIQFFVGKEHMLVLPLCQQPKWFRLQGHFFTHLLDAVTRTVKGLRIFIPVYMLCGGALENSLSSLLNVSSSNAGLLQLVSVSSLAHCTIFILVCGTINHMMWRFGLLLFRVFQTEIITFPVLATFAEESSRLLTLALQAESIPLLKQLAFADLCHLAQFSPSRRKQVFSLTPLGTPAVWGDIHAACVSVLRQLIVKLGGITSQEDVTTSIEPITAGPTTERRQVYKGWSDDPHIMSPPGVTRRHFYTERARLGSAYDTSGSMRDAEVFVAGPVMPSSSANKITWGYLASSIKTQLKGFLNKLKKKPFFMYFIGDLPDATAHEAFAQSQLYVWAITGLAHLSAASYTEDTYGVVQKTLPSTLSVLLELSQLLEKQVRQPFGSLIQSCNPRLALELNGKYAVKSAVQTGLYLLARTFHQEMRSVQLNPEQIKAWTKYLPR